MRLRARQWIAAGTVVLLTFAAAAFGWWPFKAKPPALPTDKAPSLAQFFLQDRLTLGYVRLAISLLAIFVVASIPALAVAGRWIRGFGREGLPVDEQVVKRLLGP